ncbi:MAG: 2,3-bisphosphoglycerate-independent phosphoglycerate mutase [Caldimicrobium sp.]|nr:2,3-bisphosphoglycerate-independent phosphoglycerate mutase [Caldimicrobium sp.]
MELRKLLKKESSSKILFIVLDGVGDLPFKDGKTPIEYARTPNLDDLAKISATGAHIPVDYGITPGSGPGHLGIFGYEPTKFEIGRGILEALGLGLEVRDTDVAIRGNFATVRYEGDKPIIIDRRAGRISTEENRRIIANLSKNIRQIEDVEVILCSGREHRFSLIFRFPNKVTPLAERVNDTDPQATNKEPLMPMGANDEAERVAKIARSFIERASEHLKEEVRANYVLLRGFSVKPELEPFPQRYGLRSLCIAVYPMYRGLARLLGMDVATFEGERIEDELSSLKAWWHNYDFFFVHIKKTDSFGEDGDFEGKVKVLEEFDKLLPEFLALKPEVLVITGDHSTPCIMKSHSWHPVPVLIHSPYCLGRLSERFTERECFKGELGIFPSYKLLQLILSHGGRLQKYGA